MILDLRCLTCILGFFLKYLLLKVSIGYVSEVVLFLICIFSSNDLKIVFYPLLCL